MQRSNEYGRHPRRKSVHMHVMVILWYGDIVVIKSKALPGAQVRSEVLIEGLYYMFDCIDSVLSKVSKV